MDFLEEQQESERELLRRIEQGLQHGDAPKDPRQRIEQLVSGTQHEDYPSAALLMVVAHANMALRCRKATLEALADRSVPGSAIRAIGEASMAAVALYLAADATRRYCIEQDEPGPLGRRRLDDLVSNAEHMRDCVMHWDDKARVASPAFLNVTDHDVLVVGAARPGAKGPSTIAGLPWKMFESYADRLRRWAQYKLDGRLVAIDVATGSDTPPIAPAS